MRRRAVVLGVGAALLLGGGALGLDTLRDRRVQARSLHMAVPPPEVYLARATTDRAVGGDDPGIFPGTPRIAGGGRIAIEKLLDAEVCGQAGCHPDITRQWRQSMHHLASFNNPFYRRSVDDTRARHGDAGARWCAGCHDPVLLLSGTMDGPVTERTPGADIGVTCLICHSIGGVQDLTGNGRYVLDLHEVDVLRPDHVLRQVAGAALKVFPRPHKHGYMKPLHKQAEFCSPCHRVSLTPAQNHYRWLRGQDQYDTWQSGGASGRVARSFRTPKAPQRCQDCHMPLVPSQDAGHKNGYVRSHSFPGANAAVPQLLGHLDQAALTTAFLKGSVRVDVIAVREVSEWRDTRWHLPLDAGAALTPGAEAVLDVVVRNLKVGHGFPEGVLDNKDIFLEVTATDGSGREVWREGGLDAAGDVLASAHRYGVTLLDGEGRRIDRRNVNDFRIPVFRRQIGPGQADLARYRFRVPAGASALTFSARLRYRKVKQDFARLVYTGSMEPGHGPVPAVPAVPIIDVAGDQVTVAVGSKAGPGRQGDGKAGAVPLQDRLQDYGVAFFLSRDTGRARGVYSRLVDGWPGTGAAVEGLVGLARVSLLEGDDARARSELEAARALIVRLQAAGKPVDAGAGPRAQALLAQALGGMGAYDEAIAAAREVLARFPLDRSMHLDLGFLYFQKDAFADAVRSFQRALELDPDDAMAHSMLARCYQALGRGAEAERAQRIFDALREDEAVHGLRQRYLDQHPDELLETAAGHEHLVAGAP